MTSQAVREALEWIDAIIVRAVDGDPNFDWRPTIAEFARKARTALASAPSDTGAEGWRHWVQKVYDTFVQDEAQGYRSRDRKYAIALLAKALAAAPPPPHGESLTEDEHLSIAPGVPRGRP